MTNVDINTIGNTAFSTTNRESLVITKILSTFFSKKKKKKKDCVVFLRFVGAQ